MQSQAPRSTVLRRNMSSRPRRLGRLPLIGVLAVVGLMAMFFFWPTEDERADDLRRAPDAAASAVRSQGAARGIPEGVSASAPGDSSGGSFGGSSGGSSGGARSLTLGAPPPRAFSTITTGGETATTPPPPPEIPPATPPAALPTTLPTAPPTAAIERKPPAATPGLPTVEPAKEVVEVVREVTRALPPPKPFTSGKDAAALYNRGDQLLAEGKLIEGRAVLSRLLFAPDARLSSQDATVIRNRLAEVNRTLFWSPEIFENDPIAGGYVVDSLLSPIAIKHRVPYQLLERVNGIKAERLQRDKRIKVIKGPLHARVIKHRYLMDVFALDADQQPVFVHSFRVGLGADDKTPVGRWQVIAGSKVTNPSWRDDQSGEYFAPDNPDNPIGEYWIAIRGLDESNQHKTGFGIHGTIEPETIGTMSSRGCIRLADGDIDLVFNMLTDHSQGSTVTVLP